MRPRSATAIRKANGVKRLPFGVLGRNGERPEHRPDTSGRGVAEVDWNDVCCVNVCISFARNERWPFFL